MLLPIDKIREDGGTQPRSHVSLEVVDRYQDEMQEGVQFPPVDVFYDGTDYWLADGFHRIKAAFQSDFTEMECNVHQGTLADAQWFSFGANKAHGYHRSNADKQRAVKAALAHEKSTELSDIQIAQHCGVSRETIRTARPLANFASENGTPRKGRDGRIINVTNIGRKAEAPASSTSSATAVTPAKEKNQREDNAQKKRMIDMLSSVRGSCRHLPDLDIAAIAACTSREEIDQWSEIIACAVRSLSDFKKSICGLSEGEKRIAERVKQLRAEKPKRRRKRQKPYQPLSPASAISVDPAA